MQLSKKNNVESTSSIQPTSPAVEPVSTQGIVKAMLAPSTKAGSRWLLILGLLVSLTSSPLAHGQTTSFDFSVSGDASILAFADDPVMLEAMIKRSMWRFDNAIDAAFSRPAIDLTNTSTSGALITSLQITIGNPDFNFDSYPVGNDLIEAGFGTTLPAGIVATVTDFDSSAATAGNADANVLSLDFTGVSGGGLAPGTSILFNTQLGFDTPPVIPNQLPSFDRVFFSDFGSPDPNSQITVTFLDPSTNEISMGVQTLEDISVLQFQDAIHSNETRFFQFQTVSGTPTVVIPEPASMIQIALLSAMLASAAGRRRSA